MILCRENVEMIAYALQVRNACEIHLENVEKSAKNNIFRIS